MSSVVFQGSLWVSISFPAEAHTVLYVGKSTNAKAERTVLTAFKKKQQRASMRGPTRPAQWGSFRKSKAADIFLFNVWTHNLKGAQVRGPSAPLLVFSIRSDLHTLCPFPSGSFDRPHRKWEASKTNIIMNDSSLTPSIVILNNHWNIALNTAMSFLLIYLNSGELKGLLYTQIEENNMLTLIPTE